MTGPVQSERSSVWSRLYNGQTNYDIVGRRRIWFTISAVLILIGLVALGTRGLNLGIDFTGGTVWEVEAGSAEVTEVSDAMAELGYQDVQVQETTQAGGGPRILRIKAESTAEPAEETTAALAEATDALDAAVDAVPEGVRPDLQRVLDELEAIDGPFAEAVPTELSTVEDGARALTDEADDLDEAGVAAAIDPIDDAVTELAELEIAQRSALYGDVTERLAELTGTPAEEITTDTVGPSWGRQISEKARNALVVFLLAIGLFITIRFELKMAIATIVALLHDLLLVVGLYALFGFPVTPATVVALLTMLGFSIYDGIVVFDRIDENTAMLRSRSKLTYSQMANVSLNQVLMRSLNTSITTLLPIVSVLLVGSLMLGATTLEEFGLALLLGLLAGAYSSIFIATPLLAILKEREPRYRELREQITERGHGAVAADREAEVDDDPVLTSVLTGGAAPRPRKQRKKR